MDKNVSGSIPVPPMTNAMWNHALSTAKQDDPLDVVRAGYDHALDMLDLTLRCGIIVRLPRMRIWELASVASADVAKVEIQPGGDGLSFDAINMHISVAGLLRDELGPLFARAIGRKARGRTSLKKAATSKENGKKGGRPKQKVA
jgi:hypothetical protein